jgi:hypothetical protein
MKNAKKEHKIITVAVGIITFALGVLAGVMINTGKGTAGEDLTLASGNESTASALQQGSTIPSSMLIRVNDGDVEWYDGTRWNKAGTVEELEANDKYNAFSETRIELEEQIMQENITKMQTAQQTSDDSAQISRKLNVGTNEKTKNIDENKSQQKLPATVSKTTKQSDTQTPTASQGTTATVDNDSSSDDTSDDSEDNASSDSGSSDSGSSDSGSDSGSSGGQESDAGSSDTGDGENMEWSDDYL